MGEALTDLQQLHDHGTLSLRKAAPYVLLNGRQPSHQMTLSPVPWLEAPILEGQLAYRREIDNMVATFYATKRESQNTFSSEFHLGPTFKGQMILTTSGLQRDAAIRGVMSA